MRTIPLTKGYVTIVDDEDYKWACTYNWCASFSTGGLVYAYRSAKKAEQVSGKPYAVFLHREILGLGIDSSIQGDHRNHDSLDNRRKNLRKCTRSQNMGNQRKTRGSSRYKGVTWNKGVRKWQAAISLNKRSRHLGYHIDEVDAARAYDRAALEQWGEFACLNFPTLP